MDKASNTRMHILEKAFEMVYQNGFQATSIDKIIEKTQVTKGAFYYHFKNKEEMGIAIIREIIRPALFKNLLKPLQKKVSPNMAIYTAIKNKLINETDYYTNNGCPTNNLVQEMSGINVDFYKELRSILDNWVSTIEQVLEKGKQDNLIKKEVNPKSAAQFIVAGYEGIKGMGKVYGKEVYNAYLEQLKAYLHQLT